VFPGVGSPTDYSGAYTSDGTLGLAYKPSTGAGSQAFAVNLGAFSGPVTAQWYDPTAGTYLDIGSFDNSGTYTFHSPDTNSAGQNDFVLVLTGSGAAPVPHPPIGPTAAPGNALLLPSRAAAGGAIDYDIYHAATSSDEGNTPPQTGIPSTAFTDTGLSNGTDHDHQVNAVNSASQSGTPAKGPARITMRETSPVPDDDTGDHISWDSSGEFNSP
jgi:hypothetical protein